VKEDKFLDGISNIDADVVQDFVSMDNELKKKNNKSKAWIRLGAAAACIALIVGAVFIVPAMRDDAPEIPPDHTMLNNDTDNTLPSEDTTVSSDTDVTSQPEDTTVSEDTSDTLPPEDTTSPPAETTADRGEDTTAPPEDTTVNNEPDYVPNETYYLQWKDVGEYFGVKTNTSLPADLPYKEGFCEVKSEKYGSYEEGISNVPQDRIGNKIDNIVIRTGWRYSLTGEESDIYEVNADVYEIDGISPDIAVAVKYLKKPVGDNTEYYYMYLNPDCNADSIYDFLGMYNAEAYLKLGSRVYIFPNGESSNSYNYEVYDEAIDDIKNLILNLTSTACYNKYTEDNIKAIEKIGENREDLTFGIDGAVVKVNN